MLMKVYGETNPIIGMKKYFTDFLGFTLLDILVLWSVPYTSMISCTIYLFSFKKISPSFSDVCGVLTSINKDIYESSDLVARSTKKSNINISIRMNVVNRINYIMNY